MDFGKQHKNNNNNHNHNNNNDDDDDDPKTLTKQTQKSSDAKTMDLHAQTQLHRSFCVRTFYTVIINPFFPEGSKFNKEKCCVVGCKRPHTRLSVTPNTTKNTQVGICSEGYRPTHVKSEHKRLIIIHTGALYCEGADMGRGHGTIRREGGRTLPNCQPRSFNKQNVGIGEYLHNGRCNRQNVSFNVCFLFIYVQAL